MSLIKKIAANDGSKITLTNNEIKGFYESN